MEIILAALDLRLNRLGHVGGQLSRERAHLLSLILEFERKLVEVQEGAGPASKAQLAELASLHAGLEREVQETKPEHSRLYDTDLRDFVRTGT